MKKNGVLKDMWDAIRKDDRPHWEVIADDGIDLYDRSDWNIICS